MTTYAEDLIAEFNTLCSNRLGRVLRPNYIDVAPDGKSAVMGYLCPEEDPPLWTANDGVEVRCIILQYPVSDVEQLRKI